MIHASASKIAETIANDRDVLLAMNTFLAAANLGDAVGEILEALPAAIAASSPFESEADLTVTVHRETLLALHALALRRLPARGRA
jgi:hypothetical protein